MTTGHVPSAERASTATVRRQTTTTLMVDYDGTIPRDFEFRLRSVVRGHRLRVERVGIFRTRHGYHVSIVVRGRIAFARCVLLQALLGSDWKRELFNSRRALAWRRVPSFWRSRANVLYQRHHRGIEL